MERNEPPPHRPARRKRRSRAEGQRLLEAFAQSGLSQTDFAYEQGIPVRTLRKWLYTHRELRPDAPGTFAAVRLAGPAVAHEVEVRLRSGLCVSIPLAAGAAAVADLIRQLDRPC
jgi:transposase-like protein